MKDVICSFASKGREDYRKMLLRLIDSAKEHWNGDMLIYSPDHELSEYRGFKIHKGWPQPKGIKSYPHAEMPYQFKTAMIQQALEMGYERIIWLDSSMIIKKDLTPLFDHWTGLTFFHNLGHDLYKYISDDAIRKLYVSEHSLVNIPQVWGGAFVMNFMENQSNPRYVFERIKEYSLNGSFRNGTSTRNGFIAHRHDQAVMSVIVHGIARLLPYGNILCPPHDSNGEFGNDPYLICKGL